MKTLLPSSGLIPVWLKVAYLLFLVVWVPVYWSVRGPENFLWLCDVANLLLGLGLLVESPLLVSSQAVGVLLVQTAWVVDVAGRAVLGAHPIGGTEYMFDPATPEPVRLLSWFHAVVPVLLVWGVWRLGYDRRGWVLETAVVWFLLPATYFWTDPADAINWVWRPFGVEQVWMPTWVWVGVLMVAYPVCLFLPVHGLLTWWARKAGRGARMLP